MMHTACAPSPGGVALRRARWRSTARYGVGRAGLGLAHHHSSGVSPLIPCAHHTPCAQRRLRRAWVVRGAVRRSARGVRVLGGRRSCEHIGECAAGTPMNGAMRRCVCVLLAGSLSQCARRQHGRPWQLWRQAEPLQRLTTPARTSVLFARRALPRAVIAHLGARAPFVPLHQYPSLAFYACPRLRASRF